MIQRGNEGLYHLWTGDKWATFDDPDINTIFDLMGVEPAHRVAMREYYSSQRIAPVDDYNSGQQQRSDRDRAVKDFTRVCEQTGLIDKLRKDKP